MVAAIAWLMTPRPARYDDLLRPVADCQPEGFCKPIIEPGQREIIGAHVLGEYRPR